MTDNYRAKDTKARREAIKKGYIPTSWAADFLGVTLQAIYIAIKKGRLIAQKIGKRIFITPEDLDEYRFSRYSRRNSRYNGELLYDNENGFYSVRQVSEMLEVPDQTIYYAARIGKIGSERKGAAWVIHIDDVRKYQKEWYKIYGRYKPGRPPTPPSPSKLKSSGNYFKDVTYRSPEQPIRRQQCTL